MVKLVHGILEMLLFCFFGAVMRVWMGGGGLVITIH